MTATIMADPLQEPALQPPPGVISQFPTLHSDQQAWFYVVATLCAVVPGTLLFLRLYTKFNIIRKRDATDCSTYPFRSPPPFPSPLPLPPSPPFLSYECLQRFRPCHVIFRKQSRKKTGFSGLLIQSISFFLLRKLSVHEWD